MSDPTTLVISGTFAMALAMFVVVAALRGWSGILAPRATSGGDVGNSENPPYGPPSVTSMPSETLPELPAGRVPVRFYMPMDLLGAGVVFLVFSGLVLASLRSKAAAPVLDPGTLMVNIGFQFMMAGLVAVMMIRRIDWVSWLGLRWRGWPWVFLIAPGAVGFMWLVFGGLQFSGYVKWMESLGVETVQDTVKLLQESDDPALLGLMSFAAVIAAPLCEELVFRGYFYPVLKKFVGLPVAALCSALVFAAAHGSLTALLPLIIFGCVLVFLYEKTGSLWAPIAAHFCFNGATVVIQMAIRYLEIPIQMPQ